VRERTEEREESDWVDGRSGLVLTGPKPTWSDQAIWARQWDQPIKPDFNFVFET
jgi:hypothetical protein